MTSIKILIAASAIVLQTGCVNVCDDYLNKKIGPQEFKGIITNKVHENLGCHGAFMIQQNSKIDTIRGVCYCTPEDPELWDYLKPGDSVYKPAGSLVVKVFRKDTAVVSFQFPCCNY